MRIEKLKTYYGYDLLVDRVLYKRCLNCESWFPYEDEMGFFPFMHPQGTQASQVIIWL